MIVPAEQVTCPRPEKVSPAQLFLPNECGEDLEIAEVKGVGTRQTITDQASEAEEVCCYPVEVIDHDERAHCSIGRPFLEDGTPLLAELEMSSAPADRRAAAWTRAGAEEHASVAAFSRLALELMAVGAPLELLAEVQRAALDEVSHTQSCFELARYFGAPSVAPRAFPFTRGVDLDVSLAELAAAAAREGCLAETLGAHLAAEASELCEDAVVKRALRAIADDESRHAVLSFRIVAWALRVGDEAVRAAVHAAFARPWPEGSVAELAVRTGVDVSRLRAAAARGVTEVLEPAAAALLAA